MWASVGSVMVSRFRHLLRVGMVYNISKFLVVSCTGEFRPVDRGLKLLFQWVTSVELVDGVFSGFPLYGFCFGGQNIIVGSINNDTVLTCLCRDVVGCLSFVGEFEVLFGGVKRRVVELISDFSVTVRVVLLSKLAEEFVDVYGIVELVDPVMLVFTSTKVCQSMGVLQFCPTGATVVYVNLADKYVQSVKEIFSTTCPFFTVSTRPWISVRCEEQVLAKRVSVSSLLIADWASREKGSLVSLLAVVNSVVGFCGWHYFGCKSCMRCVEVSSGSYKCTACNDESTTLIL